MLILVELVFKNLRNSGMGSNIIWGGDVFYQDSPPAPPTSKYYQQNRSVGARPQDPGRPFR